MADMRYLGLLQPSYTFRKFLRAELITLHLSAILIVIMYETSDLTERFPGEWCERIWTQTNIDK